MIDWTQVTLLLYIVARMSGFVLFNPILGRRNIPSIFRAGLVLVLSVCVLSTAGQGAVAVPATTTELVMRLLLELALGFLLGMVVNFFFYIPQLAGEVIAAVVMFLLNYTIKNGAWVAALPAIVQNVFAYPMLAYSIALIIVILFRPKGIMGSREFALCDIPRWPARIRAHFADAGAARAAKKEVSYHG